MSTTDNNKLLAEFMGFQQTNIGWYDAEEVLLRTEIDNTFDNLKFHTDWNWLMQVAEKIDEVCGIDLHEWDEHINNALCSKSLFTTYNACVSFVKWYNTQEL
jgi:hypothetical protein